MTKFIQLHLLTSYPASNLNRDDLGRPKTVRMGGTERLRISSQSLKRNWRISDLFQMALGSHTGTRTKMLGTQIEKRLLDGGIDAKKARTWAAEVAATFGKLKKDSVDIEQLVHVSPEEQQAISELCEKLIAEKRGPESSELSLLRHNNSAVDIAMFGRMLANSPSFNVEAACQVAHAISVHSVTIEDDYFTAVDDLNSGQEDAGAAHIGESAYAAALFYSYICIDKQLLVDNLGGDLALANQAIAALTEAAVKVSPKGKQNSFASRAYASFVMAEKGSQQPRSLSVAYLKPVWGDDYGHQAVQTLLKQADNFDKVYGQCADSRYYLNANTGEGSLDQLIRFITD